MSISSSNLNLKSPDDWDYSNPGNIADVRFLQTPHVPQLGLKDRTASAAGRTFAPDSPRLREPGSPLRSARRHRDERSQIEIDPRPVVAKEEISRLITRCIDENLYDQALDWMEKFKKNIAHDCDPVREFLGRSDVKKIMVRHIERLNEILPPQVCAKVSRECLEFRLRASSEFQEVVIAQLKKAVQFDNSFFKNWDKLVRENDRDNFKYGILYGVGDEILGFYLDQDERIEEVSDVFKIYFPLRRFKNGGIESAVRIVQDYYNRIYENQPYTARRLLGAFLEIRIGNWPMRFESRKKVEGILKSSTLSAW